jgi:hypothetical protein
VARERKVTLGVLLLLVEMERRRLHRERYSSLFAYCTDRLGYSRSAAGRRIAAARCLHTPAPGPALTPAEREWGGWKRPAARTPPCGQSPQLWMVLM